LAETNLRGFATHIQPTTAGYVLGNMKEDSVVIVWLFSRSVGVDRCFHEKVGDRFRFRCLYTSTKYRMGRL